MGLLIRERCGLAIFGHGERRFCGVAGNVLYVGAGGLHRFVNFAGLKIGSLLRAIGRRTCWGSGLRICANGAV